MQESTIDKCPACGSRQFGEGVLDGYASMRPKGKAFRSSSLVAQVCTNCGLIINLKAKNPAAFIPKDRY